MKFLLKTCSLILLIFLMLRCVVKKEGGPEYLFKQLINKIESADLEEFKENELDSSGSNLISIRKEVNDLILTEVVKDSYDHLVVSLDSTSLSDTSRANILSIAFHYHLNNVELNRFLLNQERTKLSKYKEDLELKHRVFREDSLERENNNNIQIGDTVLFRFLTGILSTDRFIDYQYIPLEDLDYFSKDFYNVTGKVLNKRRDEVTDELMFDVVVFEKPEKNAIINAKRFKEFDTISVHIRLFARPIEKIGL